MLIQEKRKRLFGTDGVRGRANHPPMTVETALMLGRALGYVMRQEGGRRVVIGKDTRLSCYMFENALIAGFLSMGIDTSMVGPLPTPGVAFITRAYRADLGVVISASHNPYYDNGIKFFSPQGFKFSPPWEERMEEIAENKRYLNELPKDESLGRNRRVVDAGGRYIEFVKATYPKHSSLKGMRIALDCAHGAGYSVAPNVFSELDGEVFAFGVEPNGLNINDGCGSLYPSFIQRKVVELGADCGIALDGDADRIIMVDETGGIVDGDRIMAICAIDLNERGLLPGKRIVATPMSNCGFLEAMRERSIEVIESDVGDRAVVETMVQSRAFLGGEQSGHIVFLEHSTTGDGLLAALQILRIMKERKEKLSTLARRIFLYPQGNFDITIEKRIPLEELELLQATMKRIRTMMDGGGRFLVRYSGTQPLLRIMVEARSDEMVSVYGNELRSAALIDLKNSP